MNFEISDLRARPEFFDSVADRIWQAWWKPRDVPLSYIRERLTENLNDQSIPLALVAHRDAEFLGTASLIASDLEDLPQYTPWVAAVWTEPAARSQGLGRALVESARAVASTLGYARVYLCTVPERRSFYMELGWTALEDRVGPREVTVFVKETSGLTPPARHDD